MGSSAKLHCFPSITSMFLTNQQAHIEEQITSFSSFVEWETNHKKQLAKETMGAACTMSVGGLFPHRVSTPAMPKELD